MIITVRLLIGAGPISAVALLLVAMGNASTLQFVTTSHAQAIPKKAPATKIPATKRKAGAANVNKAIRLLKSGKTVKATALLNKAITAGGMPSKDMARALHYRGIALRKQGKPAEAIADLTSALWLKNGLSGALRAEAEANRAAAYKEAGFAQATGRVLPTAPSAASKAVSAKRGAKRVRTAKQIVPVGNQPTTGWQVHTTPRTAAAPPPIETKSTGNAITGFFSKLFSTGSKPKPVARQAPAPQISAWNSATTVNVAQPAKRLKNSKSTKRRVGRKTTKIRTAPAKKRTRKKVASIAGTKKAAAAAANAHYRLILSPIRSEAKARANAQAMKQRFASVLAARQPVVETTSFGGKTFYQVRIGPFKGAQSPRNICSQLKAGGVDCMLSKL